MDDGAEERRRRRQEDVGLAAPVGAVVRPTLPASIGRDRDQSAQK